MGIWRKPFEEVLSRSFSDTVLNRSSIASRPGSAGAMTSDLRNRMEASRPSVAPLTLDSLPGSGGDILADRIDVRMMDSMPGKLKVRVIVPSKDKVRQTVSDRRLSELVESQTATASVMTRELAKHLRRSGCLLPKYGIQVNVKRLRQKDLDRDRVESADRIEEEPST